MKEFFKRLFSVSLLQQLTMMIVAFGIIILLFFSVYIKGNINDFVTNQCMSLLQRSQDTIVQNYDTDKQITSELSYDADIVHFVFSKNKLQTYYGKAPYEDNFLVEANKIIDAHKEGVNEGILEYDGAHYYYRICTISNNVRVISFLHESYSNDVETQLLQTVSNNSAIVFSILFFILILWVGTIITPLQQIKNYIEKVRKGDNGAVLAIERSDEIGEVAKALVDMKDEIERQEQTKEEMIHNISHDLKTPIAIIKSYGESIKDGIYPYDSLEKSVDVIIDNATRLEKKVYSLLFLNRLDYVMDQEKDTDKTTDMSKLMKDIIQSFKMIRPEVKVEKYLEKNVEFKGDEESWRVVISNLLDNALRYADKKIVIDLQTNSFTVYNDGPQLSQDQQKKMFKPFEKGDKGKFGLGLSICSKVCSAYGFNIIAENMPNGVIFEVSEKNIESGKKEKKTNQKK